MLDYPGPGWPASWISCLAPITQHTSAGEAASAAPVPAPEHCPHKYNGVLIARSLTLCLCTHCASRQIQVDLVYGCTSNISENGWQMLQGAAEKSVHFGVNGRI